jgi:hypothetical protein
LEGAAADRSRSVDRDGGHGSGAVEDSGTGLIIVFGARKRPSGAKAYHQGVLGGAAEAAPFQSNMRQVLGTKGDTQV